MEGSGTEWRVAREDGERRGGQEVACGGVTGVGRGMVWKDLRPSWKRLVFVSVEWG